MDGKLVVGMNIHREICVLQMIGGVAILPEQVNRWCLIMSQFKIDNLVYGCFSLKT